MKHLFFLIFTAILICTPINASAEADVIYKIPIKFGETKILGKNIKMFGYFTQNTTLPDSKSLSYSFVWSGSNGEHFGVGKIVSIAFKPQAALDKEFEFEVLTSSKTDSNISTIRLLRFRK